MKIFFFEMPTVLNVYIFVYFIFQSAGDIEDHVVTVMAARYTPMDDVNLPTVMLYYNIF